MNSSKSTLKDFSFMWWLVNAKPKEIFGRRTLRLYDIVKTSLINFEQNNDCTFKNKFLSTVRVIKVLSYLSANKKDSPFIDSQSKRKSWIESSSLKVSILLLRKTGDGSPRLVVANNTFDDVSTLEVIDFQASALPMCHSRIIPE